MNLAAILVVAAVTFGVCYLVDKGYTKLFRGEAQHRSGLAVRMSKRYALFGLLLLMLGVLALFFEDSVLRIGGILVALMGAGLVTVYLSNGIFYDEGEFLYSSFGKKNVRYSYADICHQKLYLIQGGSVVVELHMKDGGAVSVQSTMDGAFAFLDYAFYAWCSQTGRDPEGCPFHDPANSVWFPTEEA